MGAAIFYLSGISPERHNASGSKSRSRDARRRDASRTGSRSAARRRERRERGRRRVAWLALPLLLILIGGAGFAVYRLTRSPDLRATARRFVTAWTHDRYGQMYALLDARSRRALSEQQFAAELQAAARTATLASTQPLRLLAIHHGLARESIAVHTRVFGSFDELLRIPLQVSGTTAGVRFSSSLLFPGLSGGQSLSRQALLGQRGSLLTANGQLLASGSTLASALPQVAAELVGTLGPIPKAQMASYEAQGYPPDARVGQDGLEQIFQARLAGRPGGELLAGRRVLARVAPVNGSTVRTTVDPTLEQDAISALGGRYAGVTVLDPSTGAIRAAAGIAFTGLQPPGSTFKIITSAAALQAGLTTLNTTYPVHRSVIIDGFRLHNAAGESCGGTLLNAFAVSCDTTFAPLGVQIGAARLVAMAQRFGFDAPSGIPNVMIGTIPSAAAIGGPVAIGASAIGQGVVQATTLGMADAAATIANGGERPLPSFDQQAPPRFVHVTSPTIAGEIQQMMEAVVRYGTGTQAQIPGVTVAGKTGTAELVNTFGKRNDTKGVDAWFVAYAPVPNPKVVVCALFPNAGYGGATAAPVVRQLLVDALQGA